MINTRMPRLSLYRPIKSDDYRFIDRTVSEQFTAGATDLYVHKYLGPTNQGTSYDPTQPQYDSLNPTNIQDLLFLENRDRTYEPNVIRIRGHYNVQNLDFDLSQFGLFLNNDILFITVHYNTMIDLLGRKLMVGDVLELPHLLDYNPLNDTIPVSLRRFYHVTDGNYASEGFSPTWFPHLWRLKCEPLVDSQEFSQILTEPINQDNYLGQWNATDVFPAGYVVTYGNKNYTSIQEVPAGIAPTDSPLYWQLDPAQDLKDILSTYNKNIAINDATLEEARRNVPKSGYDNSKLYIVPTYGPDSDKLNQPAPPINMAIPIGNSSPTGTVVLMRSPKYKNASPVIRLSPEAAKSIWDMTADADMSYDPLTAFLQMSLEAIEIPPERTSGGSGSLESEYVMSARAMGPVTGPYGTADNTYATADQDPTKTGFIGTVTPQMDYRADCDPAYQFIARVSPRSFGYTGGYLTGSDHAPNGFPTGAGIAFPNAPLLGDYFLRTDYYPQLLFRWDGRIWVRISENVRTDTGFTSADASLLSGFINNTSVTVATDGTLIPQRQALSTVLRPDPIPLPPRI